ncbi:MAG: DUF1292 domain-containing protein [Bacilli bacterium]|nr:DUF1292 domain-containing protein [Bacilli bacterium]
MEIKDNQIIIKDDNGVEHVLSILFTYDNDERKKKYVFFFDPSNEEEIMVMSYNDSGELFEIEDDEEYEEIEEVFAAYNEDPKIQEIK